MTIVHLSNSLGGGGAEQMVLQLAKQSNHAARTIVISLSSLNTLEPKFKDANIEIHYLNITSFKNTSLIQALKQLRKLLFGIDDAVFHCHQYHSGLLGILYNQFNTNIPIVFTLHTNKVASIMRRWVLFITKPFRAIDIIFSDNSRKWYLKNNAVIPNGVDYMALRSVGKRQYTKSKEFCFLFLGRLSKPKNPLHLIALAEELIANNIDNFIIKILGDGNLREDLIEKIKLRNLENHFELLGFQDDIKPHLDVAHCLILPSLWEGMPVAVIESAAAKLPIVATPVGSIPDFLNETNAYVSDLEQFHLKMMEVINNYENALEKAEKLFEDLKTQFSIENVYINHLKHYESVL